MKICPTKVIKLTVPTIALFLTISCNKDSDLLADYVVGENAGIGENVIDLENGIIITSEDKLISINILRDNRSSAIRKSAIVKKVSPSINGNTEIKTDSVIVYTPNEDFNGKDTITYTVEETTPDNSITEKETTIEVEVSPVSDAIQDTIKISSMDKVTVDVLQNDTFTNKDRVKISKTTPPSKGKVTINQDNSLTYTPNSGVSGEDNFTYTAEVENSDKSVSRDEGKVTVNITKSENKGDIAMGELLAFPGAEGFGKYTTGGRGGKVVFVTNLNDSGSGSLREAIEKTKGARTVVFRVSGYIDLTSYVSVNVGYGNLTIAGETAPGDGITLKGYGLQILEGNVIVRHLRARIGKQYDNTKGFRIVNWVANKNMQNIIIDHCSSSWGTDENIAFAAYGSNSKISNVTVQNCILSENMGSGAALMMNDVENISYYQNYLANNTARMFRASVDGAKFEGINNIFYNYGGGTQTSYGCYVDMIGNVYKNGSNVNAQSQAMTYQSSPTTPNAVASNGWLYQTDNIVIKNPNGKTNSNWNTYAKSTRAIKNSPITPYSSSLVVDKVLANVGAYPHDAVDIRTIRYFASGGGSLISSESQVGGYPTLKSGSPYSDEDGDGIDDNWELANNLNPKDKSDGQKDRNGDGYTNLEEFLYSLTL